MSSGKADEVQKGFEELGYEVERKELPVLGDGESDSESGHESGSGSDEDMSGGESDAEAEREGNDQPSKARKMK